MNCEKYKELLSEYQEGELDKKVSAEIQKHLNKCKSCQQELNILFKINSLTKELPRYTPSSEVVLKIKSSIHPLPKVEKRTEFGPVLDIDELAEFLRVSKEIIGQYLEDIPCFELGGKILFRRKSIEEWLERREKDFGFQMLDSELNKVLLAQDFKPGGKRWKI